MARLVRVGARVGGVVVRLAITLDLGGVVLLAVTIGLGDVGPSLAPLVSAWAVTTPLMLMAPTMAAADRTAALRRQGNRLSFMNGFSFVGEPGYIGRFVDTGEGVDEYAPGPSADLVGWVHCAQGHH